MFSNMNNMAIPSGRESNFFKGIKPKHLEDFKFLFWHILGKYEHLTFKTTLEFNIPFAAHVSTFLWQSLKYKLFQISWLAWFQRSLNNTMWAISSIFHFFISCNKRSEIRHIRQYCERKISLYSNIPVNIKLWNSTK